MKKLATLVAGLLFVCGVANATDYAVTTEVDFHNEKGGDNHKIELKLAKGFMAVGDKTTFIFDLKKEFYELSDSEGTDNKLGLVRRLPSTELLGKDWSNQVSVLYRTINSTIDGTKFLYTTGTDVAGGKFDLESGIFLMEDTDLIEVNAYYAKKMGDFDLLVKALNKFNPDVSGDKSHELEFKTYLNYTKALGVGFTFNTEFGFEDKDMEFSKDGGAAAAYVAPQLKYTYAINNNTQVYTGVVYEALRAETAELFSDSFKKEDGNGKVYLGFNYRR